MTDTADQKSIHVTGDERSHLALRKLGRAFIALARHQLGSPESNTASTTPPPAPATAERPAPEVNSSEVDHD
jgi:hypothetical protein